MDRSRMNRLWEVGLQEGVEISIFSRGLGGDPLALQLPHIRLAIGKQDATSIEVEIITG